MTRKDYILQYAIALLLFIVLSNWIKVPGYMDAEYYTLSAVQLSSGKGLTQPILWNYLDDPTGIPHPSHTYWMPAPSLVASAGMFLTGKSDFRSGRIPFVIISALVVPMAGWMGYRFSKQKIAAWLSAGMAVFCGYYAPYSSTIDSFFLIMVGVWVIFFCVDRILEKGTSTGFVYWLIAGMASGWIHLNRTDGFLWLVLVSGIWLYVFYKMQKSDRSTRVWENLFLVIIGYIVVTGFWYYRNLTQFNSLFVPNTSRAFWMTTYDELFMYPPELLTFQHWIASGFSSILNDRLGALANNLTAMIAVQGLVFLFPFWLVAYWKRQKDPLILIAFGMELSILLLMSVIFPYSGKRGGFLHSSAALQPVFWGLGAAGAVNVINWIAVKRNWNPHRALKMFIPGIVAICALVTVFIFQMVAIGENPSQPVWQESHRGSVLAKELLEENNIPVTERILINNPAGFGLDTGRETLVIPYGDTNSTLAVARKFNARYLILEKNIVPGLKRLYLNPQEFPDFTLIEKRADMLLLRINAVEGAGE